MDLPDVVRVTCVLAHSPLAEPHEIIAAGQVILVRDDGLDLATVRRTVLGLAGEGAFTIAERRSFYFWGERGDDVAELGCTLADDHPLTVERFVKTIRDLVPDSHEDRMLGDVAPPTDVGAAWEQFAEFVERGARASRLRATSTEELADGWAIEAVGRSGYGYAGWLSADGRVAEVRRIPFARG